MQKEQNEPFALTLNLSVLRACMNNKQRVNFMLQDSLFRFVHNITHEHQAACMRDRKKGSAGGTIVGNQQLASNFKVNVRKKSTEINQH